MVTFKINSDSPALIKILMSITTGILLTASFPPFLGWTAWIALVPLLISLENESSSSAFKLGFLAGITHYMTLIFWIVVVLKQYGGLGIEISIAILILLCAYLSLYPAVFSFLTRVIPHTRFPALSAAMIWVSLEFIRSWMLSGFPWCLLGYSQFEQIRLIQISDITGVYGLSFLIISVNCLLSRIILDKYSKLSKRILRLETATVTIILFLTIFYGQLRLTESLKNKQGQTINAVVIQPNINQAIKWNPDFQKETMELYHRLTSSKYDFKPDIIMWPESAVPFFYQDAPAYSDITSKIANDSNSWLLFGSPAYQVSNQYVTRYYNRAYLISPEGETVDYYDKVHLVPFGEYVPLKKFLPFIDRLVYAAGDFASGENLMPLNLPDIPLGILVCFEAIFPELARAQTRNGAQILANITNDAWFGRTSASYQHLAMASFRASENKRPLIRCANTGISAFIDRYGRITSKGGLFTEEVLTSKITADTSFTFYSVHGDVFAVTIFFICLIKMIHLIYVHHKK